MNDNIREWACSFSGCDGGNINAEIWLCGIEWASGSEGNYYEKDLPNEIKLGAVEPNLKTYDWEYSLTHPYGRNFAKLYKSIKGEEVEKYEDVVNLTGNEIFKANLYPIAFDSTDHALWHKYNLDKITGFESKHLFNTWCFFNRFIFFSEHRKQYKPKLIIGTGIDYLRDFIMCFGGNESIEKLKFNTITPNSEKNKYDRTYYWLNLDDDTLLVVIPFFGGRYGLNSNNLLQEMGNRIKKLLKEKA